MGAKRRLERHETHEDVLLAAGVAHRPDPPDPPREGAERGPDLDPEVLEHHRPHRVAGHPLGDLDAGDVGHLVALVAEAREPHRVEPRDEGAARPRVPLEARVEPLLEHDAGALARRV